MYGWLSPATKGGATIFVVGSPKLSSWLSIGGPAASIATSKVAASLPWQILCCNLPCLEAVHQLFICEGWGLWPHLCCRQLPQGPLSHSGLMPSSFTTWA